MLCAFEFLFHKSFPNKAGALKIGGQISGCLNLLKLDAKFLDMCVYVYYSGKSASFHQIFKKACDIKTNEELSYKI